MRKARCLIFRTVMIVLCASFTGPADGRQSVADKIGPGVADAILTEGSAAVIISLREPASLRSRQPVLSKVRSDVSAQNAAVLATMDANSFRFSQSFATIPALVGRVLSSEALTQLVENPDVLFIGLNVGGMGAGGMIVRDAGAGDGGAIVKTTLWEEATRHRRLSISVPLIHADEWHAKGFTGMGVVVAVIDSGIDTHHDDLESDLVHEACFMDFDGSIDGAGKCDNGSDRMSGAGSAEDDLGHGTNVTGIITSDGIKSSVGVAPGAKIVSIKIIDSQNQFRYFSELIAALDYVIDNPQLGVQIINMSLGTGVVFVGECDTFFPSTARAIRTLRDRGVLAIASSMNNGSSTSIASPACLSGVIAVGASNNADHIANFSNSNALVNVVAPGVGIRSSGRFNTTSVFNGTSQAAPHVSGCAALLVGSGFADEVGDYIARIKRSNVRLTDPKNSLEFPRLDCSLEGARVAITSFKARSVNESARLDWITESKFENAGFEIQHRTDEDFEILGFVDGHGTTSRAHVYSYESPPLAPGMHVFRLRQVDDDGSTANGPQLDYFVELKGEFSLSGAFPNPFYPSTRLSLTLEDPQRVVIEAFDLLGRLVVSISDQEFTSGVAHTIRLDGSNLAPGVYFVRATGTNFTATRKVTVMN